MQKNTEDNLMEKVVSLCKRRGFVFQGSEIYGGLAGIYDYGPLGVELRHNIKQYFWKIFVSEREDVFGMSTAILMSEKVWDASGHLAGFSDPMVKCKKCQHVFREDQMTEKKKCPDCGGEVNEKVNFNLMFPVQVGATDLNIAYLRGEITQGVHVNFKNILDSMHPKLPFGVGQIGKAFRNEISPRDFLFRQREFEQMELQYYIRPNEEEGKNQFEFWKQFALSWYLGLGFKKESLRLRQHKEDEKAHYAKDAWDIEYNVPGMGWKEAWGIHHRGDWDLRRHSEYSKVDLSYLDDLDGEKFFPWDIECSGGVDRAVMFTLLEAYTEDEMNGEIRSYLKFAPHIAPIKMAVSPLLKNKPELVEKARTVFWALKNEFGNVAWDDNGNIGKRYRRQDEIGTPFCIVVDFDTLSDDTVTVRDRDTAEQERVEVSDLVKYIKEKI